jgi:hypothetical protein
MVDEKRFKYGKGFGDEWEVCFPQSHSDFDNSMVCRVKTRGEAMRIADELNHEYERNPDEAYKLADKYDFTFRNQAYADHPESLNFKRGPGPIPEIGIDPVHVVRVGQDGTDIECLLRIALAMKKYPMILLITGKGLDEDS